MTSSFSSYRLGLLGDHSAGLATATLVVKLAVAPAATVCAGNWTGIVCASSTSVPMGASARVGPSLCTRTPICTLACAALGESGASVVATLGSSSSLWPTARTVTGPFSPPQLNHVR
ncbi:MAG TPA: hypothetical protein VN804_04395 [Solirubrobacteraceae bacterium]|nr:hypothetical protein [Solirubrobacteraceae bacterium]